MTNSQLVSYQENGLELHINEVTGEVFASQNAIARMCNVSNPAISRYCSVNQIPCTEAEIQTHVGIRSVKLYSEDAIYKAFAKYNPELLVQCAKAGLRVYLHGLAGYKYQVVKPEPNTSDRPLKTLKESCEDATQLMEILFKDMGLDKAIVQAMAVEMVQEKLPSDAKLLEPALKQLNRTQVQDVPLTPTEIGEHLGNISGQKVNKLLIEKGLQIKNENRKSRKEPTYIPVGRGLEFATQTTSKGKGNDNSTYFQLRWLPSILDVLTQ